MSQAPLAQRIGEWLIRTACRRLPADMRAERCREWTAELPAILDDQSIRPSFLRTLRALTFCIGISRTTWRLGRSARAGARPKRTLAVADGRHAGPARRSGSPHGRRPRYLARHGGLTVITLVRVRFLTRTAG